MRSHRKNYRQKQSKKRNYRKSNKSSSYKKRRYSRRRNMKGGTSLATGDGKLRDTCTYFNQSDYNKIKQILELENKDLGDKSFEAFRREVFNDVTSNSSEAKRLARVFINSAENFEDLKGIVILLCTE